MFRYILLFVVFTSGCVSMRAAEETALNQQLTWAYRQNQLRRIEHWDIKGAVSVQTADDAITAHLDWEQRKDAYHFNLFGPIGAGHIKLDGNKQQVTLTTAENERYQAKDPESLLEDQVGWHIPVSNLNYWIRGLPAPKTRSKKVLDEFNHLHTLYQQGWQIIYQSYTSIKGIDLPSKLVLTNPQLKVKIVVRKWHFP